MKDQRRFRSAVLEYSVSTAFAGFEDSIRTEILNEKLYNSRKGLLHINELACLNSFCGKPGLVGQF